MKNLYFLVAFFIFCADLNAQETMSSDCYAVQIGRVIKPKTGWYYIKYLEKNLDVQWGTNNNGVGFHIWGTNYGDAQQFYIEPSDEKGYYFIKTKWGRSLDVAANNPNAEATLLTWDFHGGDNQKWQFLEAGGGQVTIKSKLGTVLDVKGGSDADGTLVWMYTPVKNHQPQKWRLVKF
jgi:hypothetical protein